MSKILQSALLSLCSCATVNITESLDMIPGVSLLSDGSDRVYLKSISPLFFRSLISKHQEEYLSILFGIDTTLTDAHSIALAREMLMNALKHQVALVRLNLNLTEGEDYDAATSEDFLKNNLIFIFR